jgi:hypothetical protein
MKISMIIGCIGFQQSCPMVQSIKNTDIPNNYFGSFIKTLLNKKKKKKKKL